MTILKTIEHHLQDEFINIILGLSFDPGVRDKIPYETLHNVWSILG